MGNIKLDRRAFLKAIGALALIGTSGQVLTGCGSKNDSEEEIDEVEDIKEQNGDWTKTGNKEVKKPYSHIIWEIKDFYGQYYNKDWYDDDFYVINENGEIIIPNGYVLVSSEPITKHQGYGSKTQGIKYNYVNVVDVEAEEYINEKTGEICYPFAGTPLDLEKAQDIPKVLSKNI